MSWKGHFSHPQVQPLPITCLGLGQFVSFPIKSPMWKPLITLKSQHSISLPLLALSRVQYIRQYNPPNMMMAAAAKAAPIDSSHVDEKWCWALQSINTTFPPTSCGFVFFIYHYYRDRDHFLFLLKPSPQHRIPSVLWENCWFSDFLARPLAGWLTCCIVQSEACGVLQQRQHSPKQWKTANSDNSVI